MPIQLGLAQILVEGGQPKSNLQRAVQAVKNLAKRGADLVLLPEAMNLGWAHPSCHTQAEAISEGFTCKVLSQLAQDLQVHLVAGLVECENGQVYNAAVLIDPGGNVILRHRKIHELDIAYEYYQRGQSLQVVDTALGRLGVMICADAFAPGLPFSRALGTMGAEVILSPCAWAVPPGHTNEGDPYGQLWRDSYRPVCLEHKLWIAGCSNVGLIEAGPWQSHRCIGCSLVMNALGDVVWLGPYGKESQHLIPLS